jgi:hypothetical protein
MKGPDKSITQRLAFIKYLYGLAAEQSKAAEPMNAVSLLMMHDAVELFLVLAAESYNVSTKDREFMGYWDVLKGKLPNGDLSLKEPMRRLNTARVNLKHRGIMSSRIDIENFRGSLTTFFQENTTRAFGLDFNAISLVDLVTCEAGRNELKEAQREIEKNNLKEALSHCRLAFHYVVDDYESKTASVSPYTPDLRYHAGPIPELQSFVDDIKRLFEQLESKVKILSLGIDGKKYRRFEVLTPYAWKSPLGTYEHEWGRRHTDIILKKDDADYCLNFVVETALILEQL